MDPLEATGRNSSRAVLILMLVSWAMANFSEISAAVFFVVCNIVIKDSSSTSDPFITGRECL